MKLLMWLATFLLVSLPLYSWPVSLGAVLILLSFSFVGIMSGMSSWWYSYVLFLVYIGGLLVMFIYVCLISSNYTFSTSSSSLMGLLGLSLTLSFLISLKPFCKMFMGVSLYSSGISLIQDSNLWLFGGLVAILFTIMLVVVRASGSGAILVK